MTGATDIAAKQVAAVRDDPAARVALACSFYDTPLPRTPRRLPYRRAAMSFMNWEIERGLLDGPRSATPGSRWWRAMNERLLHDPCEATALACGHPGPPSSVTVGGWSAFIARPTARNWYRAHNGTVAAAYVEHRDLAESESRAERFFMNVVLLRVLYAHALVAAPRFALGPMAPLGRGLGNPRLGMAGIFLSLGRVLPRRYPLDGGVEDYVRDENGFGQLLDFAVIRPRLQRLYEWSAAELELPELAGLISNGTPTYAWSAAEWGVWETPELNGVARLMRAATRAEA